MERIPPSNRVYLTLLDPFFFFLVWFSRNTHLPSLLSQRTPCLFSSPDLSLLTPSFLILSPLLNSFLHSEFCQNPLALDFPKHYDPFRVLFPLMSSSLFYFNPVVHPPPLCSHRRVTSIFFRPGSPPAYGPSGFPFPTFSSPPPHYKHFYSSPCS